MNNLSEILNISRFMTQDDATNNVNTTLISEDGWIEQNVASKSSNSCPPGDLRCTQQGLQSLRQMNEAFWSSKQNLLLIVTSLICATILAILLLHFRRKKPAARKYEILLATVVEPNSTPEDVAVNCTFGALSVGMKTNISNPEILDLWKKSGSEKKVLAVDDDKILEKLKKLAEEMNIVNVLIRDVPISSHACTTLALGPASPEDLMIFASFGRIIGKSRITPD